MNFYCFFFV
jgi:hypothetical protein